VDLGEEQAACECAQRVVVVGTGGDDYIAAGRDFQHGFDQGTEHVNFDGGDDTDADLTTSDGLEVDAGAGSDTVTGLGGSGTGIAPVTLRVLAGPGDD